MARSIPGDRAPAVLARCPDRDDADASAHLGLADGGLGFWVAGVRETFEEAGVLLARSAATGALVDPAQPRARRRCATQLNAGTLTFGELLESEDLAARRRRAWQVFSHWITPEGNHRRYDTWFFVAAAPDGHAYLHDEGETVASIWIRPADALAASDRGELELIFPTRKSLEALEPLHARRGSPRRGGAGDGRPAGDPAADRPARRRRPPARAPGRSRLRAGAA